MTPMNTVMAQVTYPVEQTGVKLRLSESELHERSEHIQSFIQEVTEDAGVSGAVIGLSGGIDSTTVAYAAVEALGADAVKGLVMPSEITAPANTSDGETVAQELGIEYTVIEVGPIVEQFLQSYPKAESDQMAVGNLRVRSRAVLNYLVANTENRVVLGTGNRSEALTGYFTKYGDGAVDCHPIGNLYKSQVRQLARHLGVPEELVTKTPSAEMWPGQTDEEELGVGYETLDAILAVHVDGPLSRSATAETLAIDPELIDHVDTLVAKSEHKRAVPPAPPRS